ncbi:hypothetical protein LIER_08374 [Lithospermum erythrorhizon]|uniref:Uncharacterized protein n=1 Tax=Lithospermum erythrorhizon TaxID=34254 RepID=A0AAV3PDQ3_LITER
MVRSSRDDATHSLGVESHMGPVPQQSVRPQTTVVDLDSFTTISDVRKERMPLEGDFKRLISFGEASRPLARKNHTFSKQVEVFRKVIATKNKLLKGAKTDLIFKTTEHEKLTKAVDDHDQNLESAVVELSKMKEAKKAWASEKVDMQARYDELERSSVGDIMRMAEAFKKEKETALSTATMEAEASCIEFANQTLQSFMKSQTMKPKWEANVRLILTICPFIVKMEFSSWLFSLLLSNLIAPLGLRVCLWILLLL